MKVAFNTVNNFYFNRTLNKNSKNFLFQTKCDTFESTIAKSAISFKGFEEIMQLSDFRCPVCGLPMLSEEQVNTFVSEVAPKKGDELVDVFKMYEDKKIFRPLESQIVTRIKYLAHNNPDLSLGELIQYRQDNYWQLVVEEQKWGFDAVKKYIKESFIDESTKEELISTIDNFTRNNQNMKAGATGKLLREILQKLSGKRHASKYKNDIGAIFALYMSHDINSWCNRNTGKTNVEIARSLVQNSHTSTEHLQTRVSGGIDEDVNYLCDCVGCNQGRGHRDFDQWMNSVPDFKNKLQNYLTELYELKDTGSVSEDYLTHYIGNLKKTISSLSNRKIELEYPKGMIV